MKNNTNKLLGLFSLIFTQSCFSMLFSLVVRPEVCSANVVAYYTFDDHVQDATANQFDGVAVNMNYSSDVPAEIDSVSLALWQDELVHRYVDLPVIRGLGPEFTVTCWLKTSNSRPGWLPVLVNNVPQSTHMALTVNTWASTDQRIVFDTRDDDLNVANAITVTNAFSLGIWHHVAWVRDGSAALVRWSAMGITR